MAYSLVAIPIYFSLNLKRNILTEARYSKSEQEMIVCVQTEKVLAKLNDRTLHIFTKITAYQVTVMQHYNCPIELHMCLYVFLLCMCTQMAKGMFVICHERFVFENNELQHTSKAEWTYSICVMKSVMIVAKKFFYATKSEEAFDCCK